MVMFCFSPSIMLKHLVISLILMKAHSEIFPHQDKSSWIKPGEMFRPEFFDEQEENREPNEVVALEKDNPLNHAIELFDPKIQDAVDFRENSWQKLFSLIRTARNCPEKILMKRFINNLLRQFRNWDTENLVFRVHFTEHDRQLLTDALDDNFSVGSVDDVISRIFSDVSSLESSIPMTPSEVFEFLTSGKMVVFYIIVISITLIWYLIYYRVTMYEALWKILVLLIFSSFFWEWIRLYKVAIAESRSMLSKYPDVPVQCTRESLWDAVSRFFFRNDICNKYHENIMVDPVWKVSFAKAVFEVVFNIIFQPLSHIGKGISSLWNQLHSELPFYLVFLMFIPAFALFVIIFYLILSFLFGVGYRIKFFGFSIDPVQFASSHRQERQRIAEHELQNNDSRRDALENIANPTMKQCDKSTQTESCDDDTDKLPYLYYQLPQSTSGDHDDVGVNSQNKFNDKIQELIEDGESS